MVQAESNYGTICANQSRDENRKLDTTPKSFALTFKGVGILILALSAVVGVVSISEHLGQSVALEQLTSLHQSTQSEADVADAILESTGHQGKMGSIPASIAALAAQAAHEKETGHLSTTVELPQIPKSIAKMAAEAKHEILIERSIDKKRKAAAAAKKALAKKAQSSGSDQQTKKTLTAVQAAHPSAAASQHVVSAHNKPAKVADHKLAAHAKLLAKKAASHKLAHGKTAAKQ